MIDKNLPTTQNNAVPVVEVLVTNNWSMKTEGRLIGVQRYACSQLQQDT